MIQIKQNPETEVTKSFRLCNEIIKTALQGHDLERDKESMNKREKKKRTDSHLK